MIASLTFPPLLPPSYSDLQPHTWSVIIIRVWQQLTVIPIEQSQTVDIPQEIKDSLRKFRFARRSAGSAALVIKINKEKLIMEEVEQFDDISIEELAEGMY